MRFKALNSTLWLLLLGALVFWLWRGEVPAVDALQGFIEAARALFIRHPARAIVLFCAVHLLGSLMGVPGSCTVLNITAGAVAGFALGCAVVYPISFLSALLAYGLGTRLRDTALAKRYQTRALKFLERLRSNDFTFLVLLRLSPLVPFNLVNILAGVLKVPLRLYALSTLVGIFFDVTLLNGLGAGLYRVSQGRQLLFLVFLFFFAAVYILRGRPAYVLDIWRGRR
jgi:uncharacterized membrane protein YdjX (TVP38/TMEM64 family)